MFFTNWFSGRLAREDRIASSASAGEVSTLELGAQTLETTEPTFAYLLEAGPHMYYGPELEDAMPEKSRTHWQDLGSPEVSGP
jgi:hypothetical protein